MVLNPEVEFINDEKQTGVITLNSEEVSFSCDFLQSTRYDLIFEINIENTSEDSVYIIPDEYYYEAIDDYGKAYIKEYAYDPENLVFELEATIERDRKRAKTEKTLGWIYFGVQTLAAVTSLANDYEGAAAYYAVDAGLNLAGSQIAAKEVEQHVVYLEGERDFFENAAIRESILPPGKSITGVVIFPRFDQADRMAFNFDIAGSRFEIVYGQENMR